MKIFRISLLILLTLIAAFAIYIYKGEIPASIVDAKYANEASQFLVMDNGARVHFRDQGNMSGPPVVLVHGSNASLHTWEPWVQILGQDYRIVTMDLPAHGLTGATPDKDYSGEGQVKTVNAVVEHLNINEFTLGGNSMGGGVTWQFAMAYPKKVNAMILVDASGFPRFWEAVSVMRAKQTAGQEKESPLVFTLLGQSWFRAISKYMDPYYLTKQGVESAYNHSHVVTDELIDRYYELALREGTREATLSRFSGTRADYDPVDADIFTQPTLVMWGREDSLIPIDVAYMFDEAIANTTLVVYDDVGHMPMEEIPQQSAEDVLKFLKRLPN